MAIVLHVQRGRWRAAIEALEQEKDALGSRELVACLIEALTVERSRRGDEVVADPDSLAIQFITRVLELLHASGHFIHNTAALFVYAVERGDCRSTDERPRRSDADRFNDYNRVVQTFLLTSTRSAVPHPELCRFITLLLDVGFPDIDRETVDARVRVGF